MTTARQKKNAAAAPRDVSARVIGAGWHQPLPCQSYARGSEDRARCVEAVRVLRKRGLSFQLIARLMRSLDVARHVGGIVEQWPTVAEDRAAILHVADLCDALAASLDGLSPRASAEVDTAALLALRNPLAADESRKPLKAFAVACRLRAAKLPAQSRRESYPDIVRRVVEIVAPLHMTVSPRAGTLFHDVCVAAFTLADLRGRPARVGTSKRPRSVIVDPTASIRAYLDETKAPANPGAVIS